MRWDPQVDFRIHLRRRSGVSQVRDSGDLTEPRGVGGSGRTPCRTRLDRPIYVYYLFDSTLALSQCKPHGQWIRLGLCSVGADDPGKGIPSPKVKVVRGPVPG